MTLIIYDNGEPINRIIADEEFAADYCRKNGYTYEVEPEPETPPEPKPPTLEERVEAVEAEQAALAAAIERGLNL